MLRANEDPLECTSEAVSGWTMYLDQSLVEPTCGFVDQEEEDGGFDEEVEEEVEEDLSMVSDASSGPPLFFHEEDYEYYDEHGLVDKSSKRRKVETHEQEHASSSLLDDTASSPLFAISKSSSNLSKKKASMKDILDFSQGFSATHFNGKAALDKHFGFLQSSPPLKAATTKPICREERVKKIWG